MKDPVLLPVNILIMTIGIAFFIIYQTLPILIQSPIPLGLGGGPVATANVQFPFMILSFVISVLSGFLISKIGNIKPTLIGSISSTFWLLAAIYLPPIRARDIARTLCYRNRIGTRRNRCF